MRKRWRNSKEYHQWREAVIKKGNYRCKICGSKKHLVAHHIYDATHYPEKRFDINNGVCLCHDCHTQYHTNYLRSYRAKSNMDRWENFLTLVDYIKSLKEKE